MKVLHVYRTYFPDPQGGTQEAIRQIAWATRPHGVETRVFTLSPSPVPPAIDRREARVIRSRSWFAPASCDIGGVAAFSRFREQLEWADVVHYHFPWPFADLLRLSAGNARPAVMTYHSDIVRQRLLGALYGPLRRLTLSRMDAIAATSPEYRDSSPVLSSLTGRHRPRVIPLGIVEESYRESVEAGRAIDLQTRFGVQAGQYFLAVGVLRYYKGLHTLIDAAARSGLKVLIAGSGPERERLAAQVASTGAPVTLLGQVTDAEKLALIAGSTAVILASHLRSEAFGVVLVEASMLGRPMISCALTTGTSFVNEHLTTGLVVAPAQPAELADAMKALRHDPSMAQTMGQAARTRYERLFSGEALGLAYFDLYRSVCPGVRAPAHGAVE